MRLCNWGKIREEIKLSRGIKLVKCEAHGGIIVSNYTMETSTKFEKLRNYPEILDFVDGGHYVFEEDVDAAMVLVALSENDFYTLKPHLRNSDKSYEYWMQSALNTLREYHPDFYTYWTGEELSIFENRFLMAEYIANNENELWLIQGYNKIGTGDLALAQLRVENNKTKEQRTYQMPSSEFPEWGLLTFTLPLDITNLQRVDLDKAA